ncbi:MAG: hypothetical protein Q9196_006038 [Gyalolechia fulgens]
MHQRRTSPYFPSRHYMIEQYQDIIDVCDATNNMPELVIRIPPNYSVRTAIPPPLSISGTTDTMCIGQTTVKSTLNPNVDRNSIAQAFNIAAGDVQAATGTQTAQFQHHRYACQLLTPFTKLPQA